MYGLRQPHLEDYARDCMDQLHIDYLSKISSYQYKCREYFSARTSVFYFALPARIVCYAA